MFKNLHGCASYGFGCFRVLHECFSTCVSVPSLTQLWAGLFQGFYICVKRLCVCARHDIAMGWVVSGFHESV